MPAKWTSATVYHLRQKLMQDMVSNLPAWEEPAEGMDSIGLVELYPEEVVAPLGNSGGWFRIRRSVRNISSSEKTLRIANRLKEAEENGVDMDDINEVRAIKEAVILQLKKETPPTHSSVDVMFRGDWFVVASGTVSVCDNTTSWLKDKLKDHFVVSLAKLEDKLSDLGIQLLSEGLNVDNITLGKDIKVIMPDKSQVEVTKSEYPSYLIDVLSRATEVKNMLLEWRGIKVKTKEDLTLSRIDDRFDVVHIEVEHDDNNDEDDDYQWYMESRARAELFVTNMPLIVKDISLHCGGLKAPPVEAQEPTI